jgi:hypothetical protein
MAGRLLRVSVQSVAQRYSVSARFYRVLSSVFYSGGVSEEASPVRGRSFVVCVFYINYINKLIISLKCVKLIYAIKASPVVRESLIDIVSERKD